MQLARALAIAGGLAATARADAPVIYQPAPYGPQPTEAPPADPPPAPGEPMTGTARLAYYTDSDHTTVFRVLGVVSQAWDSWKLSATGTIDAVSSASIDVRASPLGQVDTVTSASGRSSTQGGEMSDTRYQGTVTAGWKDTEGHALNFTAAAASESDYTSISGGANGAYDVLDRTTTLLGGVTVTDNWVSSVIDRSIHRKMISTAWTLGAARVLTKDDAVRVRYDGKLNAGDNSSPYRNVRFGDWVASGSQQLTFTNTIGSADGLLERTPDHRWSNALVGEWVHALWAGVGLHPEVRLSHDSWGVDSLTAGGDLRIARGAARVQLGYRYYLQQRADFFEDKYTMDPASYAYYTSDKELGRQRGHLWKLDFAFALVDAHGPDARRVMLTGQIDRATYTYPGFELLPSRDSTFVSIGLAWEH